MTEEDIKRKYITPAIEAKWDSDRINMEHVFTDGRMIIDGKSATRGAMKRADYLLLYKPNLPLAIVEAKDRQYPLGAGIQQAIEYARILDVPFAYSSNGNGFLEHDMLCGSECEIKLEEFPAPDVLWRRYQEAKGLTDDQIKTLTEPYHYWQGSHIPRYCQRIAINRTVEAVVRSQRRIMLVMATGSGKTFTAFQIIWRLLHSGVINRALFLADRNVLLDQSIRQDFSPFKNVMTKVTEKHLDSSYQVYLSLYHQLAGKDGDEPFRQFKPGFFDLVVVDECHRGSASEDSRWRSILDYFSPAIHIGMTATPKDTGDVRNSEYFGDPIYTYSLKQGIDDGFLAPFKVVSIILDRDLEGWRPEPGQIDVYGQEIEDREFNVTEYDRKIIIEERNQRVAERVTRFLKTSGDRFAKTIVFCVNQEHAYNMRTKLVNENQDLMADDPRYIMRISDDDEEGKNQLDNFIDPDSKYPAIVTTSKLLTTGVDCKTVKLIVLDSNINSITEFKQIIGRGTRLQIEYGKNYFTIMDFRGACRHFSDPNFDGEPFSEDVFDENESGEDNGSGCRPEPYGHGDGNGEGGEPPTPHLTFRVNGVEVAIVHEWVRYIDQDGNLTTESLTDFSKRNIRGRFARLEDFLSAWNDNIRKSAILRELKNRGVLLDELREMGGNSELDDFDLICHIAYDRKPLTKRERADGVRKRNFLSRYEGLAREVLSALLDKYAQIGATTSEGTEILELSPFRDMGSLQTIADAFGGRERYLEAFAELQNEFYAVA